MAAKVELLLDFKTGQAVQEAKNFSNSMQKIEQGTVQADKSVSIFSRGGLKGLSLLGGSATKLAYRFGLLAMAAYVLRTGIESVAASKVKALEGFEILDKAARELGARLGYTSGESEALALQLGKIAVNARVSVDDVTSLADSFADMTDVSTEGLGELVGSVLEIQEVLGKKKVHKLLAELGEEAEKVGKIGKEEIYERFGQALEEAGISAERLQEGVSVARGGAGRLRTGDESKRTVNRFLEMADPSSRGRARLLRNIEEDPSALPFGTFLEKTGALMYSGSELRSMEMVAENASTTTTNRALAHRGSQNTTRASNMTARQSQMEAAASIKR